MGFQRYRRDIKHHSKKMILDFDQHCKETLYSEEPGAFWSYDRYVRALKWGKQQQAQRFALIFAEVRQSLRAGLVMQAGAQAGAGIKCAHQVAIDGGSFRNGWVWAGMPPGSAPGDRVRFAGTEKEVHMVATYNTALDDLEKAARSRKGGRDQAGPEDDLDDEKKRLKREARAKKRPEEAAARKAAAAASGVAPTTGSKK